MTLRTTKTSIAFAAPFKLEGLDDEQPAGRYDVETDEEVVEGNGQTVYRRVATLLIVRSHGLTRTVMVTPTELEAALARDTG